jgi:hypothetical protein
MNICDIAALSEMLVPEGEDDDMVTNMYKGSVLAPGDVGGSKSAKETAKPFA